MKYILIILIIFSNACFGQNPSTSGYMLTNTNGSISIGTKVNTAPLTIANFSTAFPTPQTGTIVHLVSDAVTNGRISFDVYNGANVLGAVYQGRRAGGTAALPTAALADYTLAVFSGDGYGDDSYTGNSLGAMSIKSEGTMTNASKPTYLSFLTTPSGATTASERFRILSTGAMRFNNYGDGTFTGTATKWLAVDVDGNLIEQNAPAGSGDLLAANNLSDVANAATSRTNLGLGNVTNESKATMFTNSTFTGTFNVADGAIADADLANTVLPKLTTDANAIYGTTDAGNPGVIASDNLIRQDASYALSNVNTEQKLFNATANGRLTLETGTYFFECVMSVSGMSATSGNAAFDILGAGGATIGTVLYHVTGVDGNANTAATQTGATSTSAQTPTSMVTAGTGTVMNASLRGTFEVTAAGTIVPSITLVTASAATVAAGTYFRCRRIGSVTVGTVGQWD